MLDKYQKFFEIDSRNKNDILRDIEYLAKSYVPEWTFDLNDPDAGSIIAAIYAGMLEDDINKLNMLMYKHRVDLMNMIGITLKPANPAKSVVSFSLIPTAYEGAYVPKSTKLLAQSNSGNKIVFETQNSVYVTNNKISEIFAISKDKGKIIDILHLDQDVQDVEDAEKVYNKQFYLFDFSAKGIQKNKVVIGHNYAFNLNKDADLSIKLGDAYDTGVHTAEILADNQNYVWKYLTQSGFIPFDEVKSQKDRVVLKKNCDSQMGSFKFNDGYYISIEKKNDVIVHPIVVNSLKISSSCQSVKPEIIYVDDFQAEVDNFSPFGEKLALHSECYIASDPVFSKRGAKISINFQLDYTKNIIEMNVYENMDYKYFMRKPQKVEYDMSECQVDSVAFEYFNGTGWARLNLDNSNIESLFASGHQGDVTLQFTCPKDIQPIAVNAYTKYWIKFRILKSDNCYRMPCTHIIPQIHSIKSSYEYEGEGVDPEYVYRFSGVEEENVTSKILENQNCVLFKPIDNDKNTMLIGFDRKFEGTPISIYFDIEGGFKKDTDYITFEYSCLDEKVLFKPLKVVDETENFRHSGAIIFDPPTDFFPQKVIGKEKFWIKIIDSKNEFTNTKIHCIKIKDIIMNVAAVENVETKDMETFYVDREEANMSIKLSYKNVLYADVFVNEVTRLSIQQMDSMINDPNYTVVADYDTLGNYISFFVKWSEVDGFVQSISTDRHYVLDRTKGSITFGNASKGVIPPKQPRVAIKVYPTTCAGSDGNVAIGSINKMDTMISFINKVYNPVPAYTGHNLEDISSAVVRGASILSSHGRLISEEDFENEIRTYSDAISKVKCISGLNEHGVSDPKCITISVLMKEFEKSSKVFSSFKNEIRDIIMSKCEFSLKRSQLNVIEPIFVKLSVSIWVTVNDHNIAFEIQNQIKQDLSRFINPINGNFAGQGWEIGKLPRAVQINSFIKSQNTPGTIGKIILTGKIQNTKGVFEKEIDSMQEYPFAIGISGDHNVMVDVI